MVRLLDSKIIETGALPVMMARGASFLGSLSVKRTPGLMPILSTMELDTSRLIGMGNSVPSARRNVSITLEEGEYLLHTI
jgi:hypothetical protein